MRVTRLFTSRLSNMPKVPLYTADGQQNGDLELADAMFAVKPQAGLLHEVMVSLRANARRSIANTKTRGEVRGGGKKPWKQKGTGRARQGSTRSPQWVGGGITFGPSSERNFEVKINKKTKKKALFMGLSDKVQNNKLFVLESVHTTTPKTKAMASLVQKLPIDRNALLITGASHPALMRMVRNIQNIKLVTAQSVNLIDVLTYRTVIFLKDAVPAFERVYPSS